MNAASIATARGPSRSIPWLAVATTYAEATVIAIATRVAYFFVGVLNVDEAAHLVGARALLGGARLYVDFADNKPPAIYAFYALSDALVGHGLAGVRALSAITLLPLIATAAAAFHRFERTGRIAGALFLLSSITLLAADSEAVHCEHVMLVPVAWALVLLRDPLRGPAFGRVAAVGALVGLAALGKQPALLCGVALAVFVVMEGGSLRLRALRLAALAVGATLPVALTALWLWRIGALDDAIYWVWSFNFHHIDNPMSVSYALYRLAKHGSVIIPAAGPLAIAAWWTRRSTIPRHGRLFWLVGAALLAPAFLGMRLFGHYFVPALFVVALWAAQLFARPPRAWMRWVAGASLATGIAGIAIANAIVYDSSRGIADIRRAAYADIAARVAHDRHGSSDRLFVWGYAPSVYLLSGERPASRFVVPIDGLTGYVAGNERALEEHRDLSGRVRQNDWDALMSDLRAHPPDHIVDTAPANLNAWGEFPLARFPRLVTLVRRDYVREAVVDGAVVYRRRTIATPGTIMPPRASHEPGGPTPAALLHRAQAWRRSATSAIVRRLW